VSVAKDTVSRRGIAFGQTDEDIMRAVFENTQNQRSQ
jgi:hypothetical protein